MLAARTIHEGDGLVIADVACTHGRARGEPEPPAAAQQIVFVRRGCFVRRVGGRQQVLDPTQAYFCARGEEQRFDHPHDGGDDCTAFFLDDHLLAALYGGDPTLPSRAVATSPRLDLAHRLLLAACHRGADGHAVAEHAIDLVATTLAHDDEARVRAGRPASERARSAAVDGARAALAADPDLGLTELARAVAVSPHHLSRTFRATTGHTIARHRMRLRARAALERLAGGDDNLARLAADLGFADHGHLCRVVRAETGRTPSALRAALARV